MRRIFKLILLFAFILAFSGEFGFAQEKKAAPRSAREAALRSKRSRDSILRAFSKTDTSINSLLQQTEQYTTTFNQINNSLGDEMDTAEVSEHLPSIAKRLTRIQTLANTKRSSTLRYLFALRDNLDHLQDEINDWQSGLDDINTKLVQNQHDLVRFTSDSLLKKVPSDSALKVTFLAQRKTVWGLWHRTDSANRRALAQINLLQDQVAVGYTKILDESDHIDAKIKRFADMSFAGEFGYIWDTDPKYSGLTAAIKATIDLNNTQLYYFFKSSEMVHLIGLAFLAIIIMWIFFNRAKTAREERFTDEVISNSKYIYHKPLLASLLVATAIAPYFYDHPPAAFIGLLFIISMFLGLVLIRIGSPRSLFTFLIKMFVVALICCLSNVLIQITNFERYAIFCIGIISIIIAWQFSKKAKAGPDGQLPFTQPALKIFMAIQLLALVLNFTGRFTLAKIITITAIFNLWLAVILYLVVNILIQGLFLQFDNRRTQGSFVNFIDLEVIQKKFLKVLYNLAVLLWLFVLLQNLNIDDWAHDHVEDLLNQSRTIGGASFTFGGFVMFIIVLWLSSIASRIVSYLYDVSAQHKSELSALQKKNRASTLLIRMAVFTIGFFLAVAASGFPLDKLTIIFSAFGVGIGFGLQNIVNNLVSGLILAFEKPVQIGDTIEVDGKAGVIKEIGIRSSKLVTGDGAEVIIPNGDLISHHLINWTLSDNNRRVEIIVGVAYGTDIGRVKKLLTDLLCNREDIMSSPEPVVFVHNLNESSVDFRLLFWASDINTWVSLKSRVLADIYDLFNKEGIEIPFPQQDVHIYGLPADTEKKDQ